MNVLFEFCEMPEAFEYNVAMRFNEIDRKFYFYYRKLSDPRASAELPKLIQALVVDNPMVAMLVNGALASLGQSFTGMQPEKDNAEKIDEGRTDQGTEEGSR